jgi:hypothetical protein
MPFKLYNDRLKLNYHDHNASIAAINCIIAYGTLTFITYDHRVWRTGLPVRLAVLKPNILSILQLGLGALNTLQNQNNIWIAETRLHDS